MSTPDVGKLDLSDSDSEDLFASPSKVSKQSRKPNAKSDAPSSRNVESKYDAEQAREASLRKELESVRSINEVIEGVVSSLEVAKGNMDVSSIHRKVFQLALLILVLADCLTHSHICFYTPEHLDTNTITNGTQSTFDSESQLARCEPGCSRHGE
jgi:DASH complex subunit Duo1